MTQLDSRFYDDGREYTARDWGQVFQYLAGDGVMPGEGLEFRITENNPLSMVIHIDSGVCFIEGRYGRLEEATTKTVADADGSYDRIDRVVIRMDQVNGMDVYIKQGEAAVEPQPPELTRSESIYEISIAQVYVEAGINVIRERNVTYEKNNADVCGYSLPFGFVTQQRILQERRRENVVRNAENYVVRVEHYVGTIKLFEEVFNRDSNGRITSIDRISYDPNGNTEVLTARETITRNSSGYITGLVTY